MNSIRFVVPATLTVLMSLAVIGCGGAASDIKPVFPTSGTITRDGLPVAGARVAFVSTSGTHSAIGGTDSQGVYHLTTYTPMDGAAAGEYAVVIKKTTAVQSGATAAEEGHVADAYAQVSSESHSADDAGEQSDLLPPVYNSAETTPLNASVTPDGENKFDFSLN